MALATLAFVAGRALAPMGETDLFFHLKIGQLILQNHSIPFRNIFSFTYPDHVDPDLSWLFQVLVALLYRIGGFGAIVLFKVFAMTLASGLTYLACRRAGASPVAVALTVAGAILAAGQRIVERPHLMTFIGIAALWLILVEIERGRRRWIWFLPIFTAIWANFHAGVFFCFLICMFQRRLWIWLPLIGLAMFATPAGAMLPRYLLWHTGLGATRNIEEFRHADPWNDPWFFVLLAACALAVLALRRRTPLGRLLPALAAAVLALRSVRFVAEFAYVAAPLIALGLTPIVCALHRHLRFALGLALGLALGGAAVLAPRPKLGLAGDVVPFDAIRFATDNGLRERMYSDLDVGCYLLWEGWPRWRVFQDARLPAYPDAFHRSLDETPLAPAAFDALLARFGVDAALLSEASVNMRAGSFDPDEWALVYYRADAAVLARRGRHDAVIARHEIPLRMRFSFEGGTTVEPIPSPPARSPVAPCEWQRRLAAALDDRGDPDRALDARARALTLPGCLTADEEVAARFRLGARAQLAGHLAAAAAEYDRVLALRPDHVDALVNRGFARLASDPASSRADFTRALSLDPSRADAREGLHRLP